MSAVGVSRPAVRVATVEEWARCEVDLAAAGIPMPFDMRLSAAACQPAGARRELVAVLDEADGRCIAATALESGRSRLLPGHQLWRVRRLGSSVGAAPDAILRSLATMARQRRVLRLSVELFDRDETRRARCARTLASLGFHRLPTGRSYAVTRVLDLTAGLEPLLQGLSNTNRQAVRKMPKLPLRVDRIADEAWIPRIVELCDASQVRTGGRYVRDAWPGILRHAAAHPELSRVVGLVRTDRDGPESLVAVMWGCAHGDHVEYRTGGSARQSDLKIPLGHPLMWDLIAWAHGLGATWFDLGGITVDSDDEADPLAGISRFKRGFGGYDATVGEEWVLEPHPARATMARLLGAGLLRMRGLVRGS